MLKKILGILLIAASFLMGSAKQLSIVAAEAGETSGPSGGHEGSGATCG